jgi:excisionase family DNA binding protein
MGKVLTKDFHSVDSAISIQNAEVFDRQEAARRLCVAVVTIDREVSKGKLPHFKVGRRTLFTQAHLDEYIRRETRAA